MGILNKIFGNDETTDKVLTGVGKGLDKLKFTSEEKADFNFKISEWYLKYLEASQPQNLARRYIALVIVCLWAALIVFGIIAYTFEYLFFMGDGDEAMIALFTFEVLNELVHQPLMMIMGFYFLTHVVRTYANGSNKK